MIRGGLKHIFKYEHKVIVEYFRCEISKNSVGSRDVRIIRGSNVIWLFIHLQMFSNNLGLLLSTSVHFIRKVVLIGYLFKRLWILTTLISPTEPGTYHVPYSYSLLFLWLQSFAEWYLCASAWDSTVRMFSTGPDIVIREWYRSPG